MAYLCSYQTQALFHTAGKELLCSDYAFLQLLLVKNPQVFDVAIETRIKKKEQVLCAISTGFPLSRNGPHYPLPLFSLQKAEGASLIFKLQGEKQHQKEKMEMVVPVTHLEGGGSKGNGCSAFSQLLFIIHYHHSLPTFLGP